MPGPSCNIKNTCENCGTQITKLNLARHKTKCSVGSLICPSFTNFSTKTRAEMNYHLAKKHLKATARVVHECKKCDKDTHDF